MSTFTVVSTGSAEITDVERHLVRNLAASELNVDDAVVLQWPESRSVPRSRRVLNLACLKPSAPEFWSLLFGIAFRLPRIGVVTPPTELRTVGITSEIVTSLRENIVPSRSAIFLLSTAPIMPRVEMARPSFLLEAVLTPGEDALLDEAFRP